MAIVELSGAELSSHLARTLTDLEFEMLVRERVKNAFEHVCERNPDLSESHHYCSFRFNWNDKCEWNVAIGENYSKKADVTGEVLSVTVADAQLVMDRKRVNKLSLLLPAPTEQMEDAD